MGATVEGTPVSVSGGDNEATPGHAAIAQHGPEAMRSQSRPPERRPPSINMP